MESIYFYGEKVSKDITKIWKDDAFMRVSYLARESLRSDKKGYILYIQANSDEMNRLEQKLKDMGAEKIGGIEEKTIIATFREEENNAATGMGMIFS